MSEYYIAYEENIPWNGSVFNANEYRRAINSFYSKVDLVKPNAIAEDGAPPPNISVRNLSPDANFPNELGFNLSGKFSTSKRDELTGNYLANVTLSGDVKVPRQTPTGKILRVTIASSFKSITAVGKTPGEAFNYAFKQLRESILQTLSDQVGGSGKGIKVERQESFTDKEPALPGPPTQTISGVTNKAPVVDNPNVKLPTQEVKSLTATSAKDAVGQAKSSATSTLNQAQGSVSGLTSQAQSAASSATSQVQSAASGVTSQVQSAASSATSQVQSAASSATSQVQSAASGVTSQGGGVISGAQQNAGGILSNLSSGVTGALGGGALGAGIGALAGGGRGALIGAGAGIVAGGVAGTILDKLNPKGIKPDALGKDWSPDKFSPEAIAGNDKFVDPKTGVIGSTSKLANAAGAGLLGGAAGAGIGALASGGKGALIGGLSGVLTGVGLSVGGVTGGALAGGGLGAGIGGLAGGAKGALIGGGAGVALGAAAAKLASIKKTMTKPKIPKPPSIPRIKTVKIPRPDSTKGAEQLLNLSKSP